MQERRQNPRRKTYFGGKIVFNHRQSVLDCVITNLGVSGAKLSFSASALVPDEFELRVPRVDMVVMARVAWRQQGLAGVHLAEHVKEQPAALTMAQQAQRLATENARLRDRVLQLGG